MMKVMEQLLANRCLWTAILCWGVAQALKVMINLIKTKEFNWERVIGSGGMPSSHTASTVGLAIMIGRMYQFDSPMFAVAALFALVVMYDAVGVRQAAGKQAQILNLMLSNEEDSSRKKALKEFLGHTPAQVFVGILIGIGLGGLMPLSV